ncbi:hypothetical protein D3C71_1050250 [compost metagenome]
MRMPSGTPVMGDGAKTFSSSCLANSTSAVPVMSMTPTVSPGVKVMVPICVVFLRRISATSSGGGNWQRATQSTTSFGSDMGTGMMNDATCWLACVICGMKALMR